MVFATVVFFLFDFDFDPIHQILFLSFGNGSYYFTGVQSFADKYSKLNLRMNNFVLVWAIKNNLPNSVGYTYCF